MSQAHYNGIDQWVAVRGPGLSQNLVDKKYPYRLDQGPIPEGIFQYPIVQAKMKIMKEKGKEKENGNETVVASNRKRLPTPKNNPYFTHRVVKEIMEDYGSAFLAKDTYTIYMEHDQPKSVFCASLPQMEGKGSFKIHLMFNIKYMKIVLLLLFQSLLRPKKIPVIFKVVNYNHITAIPGRAGIPTPQFIDSLDTNYKYGASNNEKEKYGRLGETFIYSPAELKKYPVSYKGSNTFKLTGETKKHKFTQEPFELETLFDPVIVFYTNDEDYTKMLLKELLQIFPDDPARSDWVLPHFYPRANVKINNMIYLSNGGYNSKYEGITCRRGASGPECTMENSKKILDLPTEYQDIQSTCSSRQEKDQCHAANRFPMAVSDHKLCKWESEKRECKPHRVYSQHLLLKDYESLKELYEAVDQGAVLERFEAGAKNDSLPVNYNVGGRRKKRHITKKARRTRRRSSRKN